MPQIVKPYVKGEMPSAAQLLAKCCAILDATDSWTAEIKLRAATPDRPEGDSYSGTVVVDDTRVRGSLHSKARSDGTLWLTITDKQAVAWLEPAASGDATETSGTARDRPDLERVATAINLLRFVGCLPGHPRQSSQIAKAYRFTNKGIADTAGGETYVLEASQKPQQESTPEPAARQKLLIALAVADSHPRQLISQSADGSWQTVTFESIDLKTPKGNHSAFPEKPSAGAIVVNLNPEQSSAAALKNPIPYGAESIARGKRLYQADCVVCHSLDGTGRNSDVTDNAADLTDVTHWLSDGSEAATFLAIRDGAGDEMPGYEDEYGDDQKIWDLVNYIRSLQKRK